MKEVDVEREAVEWVESLGGFMPKFTSPGRPGAPDRLLILQDLPTVFVEFKRPGKKHVFQPGQPKWRRRLRKLGQQYWVVDNMRDFIQKVLHYKKERSS